MVRTSLAINTVILLVQRQAVPRPVRLLGKQDVLKQVHSQAGFDSLMNRARDVLGTDIIPKNIVELEQFISEPLAIER